MAAFLLQSNWYSSGELLSIWRWLPFSSKGIVLVLLTMLAHIVLTTAMIVAKQALARSQSRRFVSQTKEALQNGRLDSVIATAMKFNRSHVAAVVASGLRAFRELPSSLSNEEGREWVERAMNRVSAIRAAQIRLGLSTLRTIAATAPLIGVLGTMLGILNDSFRGHTGSRWSLVMVLVENLSVALMFTALGLFVAVLSMWTHDWLTKTSNAFIRDVNGTALKLVECVWWHPEWREYRETNISLELIHASGSRAHPWEVPYDRYKLLPLACVVELFVYVVMALVLCSTRTDASYAFIVGVCLLVVGIIALPLWETRNEGSSAAGQDACVAESFYHRSVEGRLRARLPLKNRLAVLPDRSLVFGMPILACLLLFLYINQSRRTPKGIDVVIASRETASLSRMSDHALVVHVQKAHQPDSYTQPPLLRIQGKLVAESELRERLKQELARHGDHSVFIYGDKELPYQSVVKIVDLVNELGGKPVLVGSSAASRMR